MNPYQSHANALASFQASLGDDGAECPTFTWNSGTFKMVPNSAMLKKDLSYGGFGLNSDLRFVALVSQFISSTFPTAVAVKDAMLETAMTYLGDNYKIKAVYIAPSSLQMTIEANALHHGA